MRHKIFQASNLCTSYISFQKQTRRNNAMPSIILTLKICVKSAGFLLNWPCRYAMIFCGNTISTKIFIASRPFNKKCVCHQLLGPISGTHRCKKYFRRMGIQLKNIYITLLYDAGQFYVKNKMAAE